MACQSFAAVEMPFLAAKGPVAVDAIHAYVGTAESSSMAAKIRFANRHFHLPQSKPLRLGIGILLVAGGLLGFLPVLGFWMIPLGLLVLSVDIPIVRRWRRQLAVWWHRRKEKGGLATNGTGTPASNSTEAKVE